MKSENYIFTKVKLIFILLLLAGDYLSALSGQPSAVNFSLDQKKVHNLVGWQYRFAGSDTNESVWKNLNPNEFHLLKKGVFVLRTVVNITIAKNDDDVAALTFFNIPAAYEIYWNSEFLGRNGIVSANAEDEELGKTNRVFTVPHSLVKNGENIIELRVSNNFDGVYLPHFEVLLSPYRVIKQYFEHDVNQQLLQLGLYFSAFIICFILFFGGWRDLSFLFFGIYVLFQAFLSAWIFLIINSVVPTQIYQLWEPIIIYAQLFFMLLLIAFFLWHLDSPKKKFQLSFGAAALLAINAISGFAIIGIIYSAFFTYLYVLILSVYSFSRARRESVFLAISVFPLFLYFALRVYAIVFEAQIDFPFFTDFIVASFFVSLTIGSISVKVLSQRKQYQEVLLKSQRLETELLKKTIQPHFILNTLLSLKHLIKTKPAAAVDMIEHLSKEFEIINEISAKKSIPIESEIELCNYHLMIMGYRRDAKYKLETEGIGNNLQIPPLVIHTLIENGLTHSFEPKEDGLFNLVCVKDKDRVLIKLTNNGSRLEKLSSKTEPEVEEGLGLKYVRSRLEESYPGKWNLCYRFADGRWEVLITLFS